MADGEEVLAASVTRCTASSCSFMVYACLRNIRSAIWADVRESAACTTACARDDGHRLVSAAPKQSVSAKSIACLQAWPAWTAACWSLQAGVVHAARAGTLCVDWTLFLDQGLECHCRGSCDSAGALLPHSELAVLCPMKTKHQGKVAIPCPVKMKHTFCFTAHFDTLSGTITCLWLKGAFASFGSAVLSTCPQTPITCICVFRRGCAMSHIWPQRYGREEGQTD